MTDEDIYLIADHIAHSIDSLSRRYLSYGSTLTFEDYILTNVAVDLSYKYNRYQLTEAFEDRRIKLLIEFYVTEEDYKDYEIIH